MKYTNTTKARRSGHLSFYLVLLLCVGMVGISCWFAYRQTADELTIELNSALDSVGELAAALPETDVPKPAPTEAPTAAPAAALPVETREPAPVFAPTPTEAPTAAPTETEPVTEAVESANVRPIGGEIIQPYSCGELVKSPTTGVWQTHNGTDYAGSLGDAVCAAADGTVSMIEEDALWGITVTIDHGNGFVTRYCSLNAGLEVMEGDTVTAGQVIGALGDTADIEHAQATHLHFEVLQGGRYVDPEEFLAVQGE